MYGSQPEPARWKVVCAYDGTDFCGWQSQVSGVGIQDVIEHRLQTVLKHPARIHGSGRTDSGVHARGQVFHFDAAWRHGCEAMLKALSSGLARTIQILSVQPVSMNFHARYSATAKRYVYHMYLGAASPFEMRYVWSMGARCFDFEAMAIAAASLLGRHDFTAFAASRGGPMLDNPVKDLRRLEVVVHNDRCHIITEASGYLYKMVRMLVGALVEVGCKKIPVQALREALESKKRTQLFATAPPQGLFLDTVFYENL